MKTNLLFPYKSKRIGLLLFLIGVVLTILFYNNSPDILEINVLALVEGKLFGDTEYFSVIKNNVTDEIIGILLLVGLVLFGFSKEKFEDEHINSLRLNALIWAVYFNFLILLISFFTIYGMSFFVFMQINLFSVLLIFILRFRYLLWKSNKSLLNEE